MPKEKRICTFSKVLTEEEAKREMRLATPIGKALKKADEQYRERRKK